jgi:hypothetical protein
MFMLRLLGRALVYTHHAMMVVAALYAFFAAMVALVLAWEALSWLGRLIRLE